MCGRRATATRGGIRRVALKVVSLVSPASTASVSLFERATLTHGASIVWPSSTHGDHGSVRLTGPSPGRCGPIPAGLREEPSSRPSSSSRPVHVEALRWSTCNQPKSSWFAALACTQSSGAAHAAPVITIEQPWGLFGHIGFCGTSCGAMAARPAERPARDADDLQRSLRVALSQGAFR